MHMLLNTACMLLHVYCSCTWGSQAQQVWGGVGMFEKLEIHNKGKKMDK